MSANSTNSSALNKDLNPNSVEKKDLELLPDNLEGYSILANTAPIMLWLSGVDKNVYFVNQLWIKYRGTSFEEEIGTKWALGVHPEDRENSWEIYSKAFDARENFSMEYRLLNSEGKYRWISSKGVPRFKDDGEFLGYAGCCADIDDQKNFAAKLEKEVRLRTKEVLEKNKELNEKNEELNSFASIASHDLKEPLRKIHLFGKMIQDREKTLSENSKHHLDRILFSTDRMQQLINDLLSYSEINGKSAIKVKTDLNVLIQNVLLDLTETIEESKAVLDVAKLPTVGIIPSQFLQVFTNLFQNAIKYSKKGEAPVIEVSATTVSGNEIEELGAKAMKNYHKIIVKDNGIGFPAEANQKVFEPFKRFHDKDEYNGTGIGLAICKKIINNHKGFIKAESAEGKGAAFTIYLPFDLKSKKGIS